MKKHSGALLRMTATRVPHQLESLVYVNQQSVACIVLKAMWPTKNAVMRAGKGRDENIITPGNIKLECVLACPHFFLTTRPMAPVANSVFWSIPLSTLLLSAGLTQARDLVAESNYRDNYDCDPVWPGFVFKWTHLPCVLEMHLLRIEPRGSSAALYSVSQLEWSQSCWHRWCTVSIDAYLSDEWFVAFLFSLVQTDSYNLLPSSLSDLSDNSIW